MPGAAPSEGRRARHPHVPVPRYDLRFPIAPRHDVGKTVKHELALEALRNRTGKEQAQVMFLGDEA
jgi:hypothetical protein